MTSKQSAFVALTLVLFPCGLAVAADTQPQVTLMGMLSEWMYPEAEFHGAEMSDAGVAGISAIKDKAVLTTADGVDKVLAFYLEKLHVGKQGKYLDEKPGDRVTSEHSVLIQDLSGDRPDSLYVIAVNGPKSSTTLVVARAEGENLTRIGWSNYRQLLP